MPRFLDLPRRAQVDLIIRTEERAALHERRKALRDMTPQQRLAAFRAARDRKRAAMPAAEWGGDELARDEWEA